MSTVPSSYLHRDQRLRVGDIVTVRADAPHPIYGIVARVQRPSDRDVHASRRQFRESNWSQTVLLRAGDRLVQVVWHPTHESQRTFPPRWTLGSDLLRLREVPPEWLEAERAFRESEPCNTQEQQ